MMKEQSKRHALKLKEESLKASEKSMYKSLKEIVGTDHTALVIWDVQNALVSSIFNKEEFLQNSKSLIKTARSNKIPIIYTRITPLPRDYESSWRTFMLMRRYGVDDPEKLPQFWKEDSPESEIHNEVNPMAGDLIIKKHTPSIFIGTHFENMMRNRGINTILFSGISTDIGIDSSARDSANRGFYTIVVQDCVSSSDKEMHEAALKTLGRICLVLPSKDIMEEWK